MTPPRRTYIYKLTSDRGGAPCAPQPTRGQPALLTLSICKPAIRRTAQPGDRLLGLTSQALAASDGYPLGAVIYAAIVEQGIDARDYYGGDRVFRTRPDCIYAFHRDQGTIVHSGHTPLHANPAYLARDLGQYPFYRNGRTLLSHDFRYFGSEAIPIPPRLPQLRQLAESLGQGHRVVHAEGLDRELDALFRLLWKLPTRHTPAVVTDEAYDHTPRPRNACGTPAPTRTAGVSWMTRPAIWIALALGSTLAAAAPTLSTPKAYPCHRAVTPPTIDGRLDDPAWQAAPWTDDFVDIEGDAKPLPRFRTRAKILWDDRYLYVAAELQEPNLKAKLTEHDSVIFHDNDFELFLKPPLPDPGYFEFEINALNTSWDLFLNKPYRDQGKADNSWDIPGLKTAVNLKGTLNDERDTDTGWTVEMAFPWAAFKSRLPVTPPHRGDAWRVNFSRVEWKPGVAREDNWVWTPQGVVNMHVPDRWGYLNFQQ